MKGEKLYTIHCDQDKSRYIHNEKRCNQEFKKYISTF